MKIRFLLHAALVCGMAGTLYAGTASQKLVFPLHGFSISPLEETSATANYVVLFMNMPPTDNFSPNINVMVQQYAGSLADFKTLSESQFIEQKWVLIKSEVRDKNVLVLEYAGKYNGIDMHWYSRVMKRGGQAYLVTGTAREIQWKQVSARLTATVDSFVLDR